MRLETGATRYVLVGRKRVYKFPSFFTWRHFLLGLLANMQEKQFSKTGWPELCPVLFAITGGFLVVMPRAEVLTDENALTEEEYNRLIDRGDYVIPAERKPDSWGWLEGRLVAIDYGS